MQEPSPGADEAQTLQRQAVATHDEDRGGKDQEESVYPDREGGRSGELGPDRGHRQSKQWEQPEYEARDDDRGNDRGDGRAK
jgi:hypothetical protein